MQDYVRRILTSSVYEVAEETPLEKMALLSARLGAEVLLKREDMQPVFSFKIRGAHNRIAQLSAEERARGVICASAGNHAQGVALSATRLGIRAVIVMPTTTPDHQGRRGAPAGRRGGAVRRRLRRGARAMRPSWQKSTAMWWCIRSTIPTSLPARARSGMELLRQHPGEIGAIYVPVGGGGLAAGIAAFVKFLRPEIRVIGVEPEEAASMKAAIAAGHPVALDQVGLFADGVAVRQVGTETFRICRELLDDIVTVTADEICAAIKDIFDDHARHCRTGGRVGAGRPAAAGRTGRGAARRADRHQFGRQCQFRPAALCGRTRRDRRAGRGAAGRRNSRAAGQLPRLHPAARPALDHRIQLSLRPWRHRQDLRRHQAAAAATRKSTRSSPCCRTTA